MKDVVHARVDDYDDDVDDDDDDDDETKAMHGLE